MKKHFRLVVSTLCIAVLILALLILVVNLYVQSKGMQNTIRARLSESLGMRVGVFRTTFSPWGGFRMDQIKIPSDIPGSRVDFLKAEFLEVRCEYLPLLRGEVIVKRIALDSPQLVFQQNAKGQFRLPVSQDESTKVMSKPSSQVSGTEQNELLNVPTTSVHKWLLRDGTLRFLANDGTELARMETVRCSLAAQPVLGNYAGVLEIKRLILLNRWEVTPVEADVRVENQTLHLDKIHGEMGEGGVEGYATLDTKGDGLPYNIRFRLNKGQLAAFFEKDSELAQELTGIVHARLDLDGFASQEDKNRGHVEIKVSRAKISGLPLLQVINQFVRSEEFGNLTVKKAELKADILGSVPQIAPSYLESDHVQVTFSGPIDAAHNLDLQAQLTMDDTLFKKLPSEARENFVKDPNRNLHSLEFVIKGPVLTPRTNLLRRIVGEKLQRKFKSFLGEIPDDESATPIPP